MGVYEFEPEGSTAHCLCRSDRLANESAVFDFVVMACVDLVKIND
jgi:hypothetical protein